MTKKSGFTLIETMIAMTVAAILGTAVVGMVLEAQAIANSAKLKNQATRYADQILENVRQYRDDSWTNLNTKSNPIDPNQFNEEFCYDSLTSFSSISCTPSLLISGQNIFKSKIGLIRRSSNVIQVNSYISYTDRGTTKNVTESTYLAKLQ